LVNVGGAIRSDFYTRKSITLDNTNPYVLIDVSNHSSYVSLGTVPDAGDSTIIRAYRRQISDDPDNTLFYLECLQDIGRATSSQTINNLVEQEIVNGLYTRFELQRAYKTLEIDHPEEIDDEGVVAVFQSRCIDVPNRERDFQHAVTVIQHFRKSNVIGETTARQSDKQDGIKPRIILTLEMTPAEAYKRLRIADSNIPDDGIIASFVSCVCPVYKHLIVERRLSSRARIVDGSPADPREGTQQSCYTKFSERTKYSHLNLLTVDESQVSVGPINQQMSMDEAYIVLGIDGRAKDDDAAIMLAYNELVRTLHSF
jgi:hypothetical protein